MMTSHVPSERAMSMARAVTSALVLMLAGACSSTTTSSPDAGRDGASPDGRDAVEAHVDRGGRDVETATATDATDAEAHDLAALAFDASEGSAYDLAWSDGPVLDLPGIDTAAETRLDQGGLASADGADGTSVPEAKPEAAGNLGESGSDVRDGAIESRDGAAAEVDLPAVGACTDPAGCTGSNWAMWPMPNTAADVANGAPHPAVLVDNGDDTISDQVTGLMWQRSASVTTYERADAQVRCAKVRLGGYTDWRVPSAIELTSIIDFDYSAPSIDARVFPDTPLDLSSPSVTYGYHGTTSVAGSPLAGWLVDFAYGEVTLDTTSLDRPAFLRCVRGPRAPANDTSTGRYDLSTAGTARDTKTGLTWQRVAPSSRRELSDARAYCATGTGLPGTGWRIPTIKELMTLVDFSKSTKFRIDETVFNAPTAPGDPYSVFWSATSLVGKPPYAQFKDGIWSVYFDRGTNEYTDSTNPSFVRCVR